MQKVNFLFVAVRTIRNRGIKGEGQEGANKRCKNLLTHENCDTKPQIVQINEQKKNYYYTMCSLFGNSSRCDCVHKTIVRSSSRAN